MSFVLASASFDNAIDYIIDYRHSTMFYDSSESISNAHSIVEEHCIDKTHKILKGKKSRRREEKNWMRKFILLVLPSIHSNDVFVCAGEWGVNRSNEWKTNGKQEDEKNRPENKYLLHSFILYAYALVFFFFAYNKKNQMSSWHSCWKIVYHSVYVRTEQIANSIESKVEWNGRDTHSQEIS